MVFCTESKLLECPNDWTLALIDRSVQELATPVLRISILVAVLFRVVAWVHYCLSYTSMILYNCLMVYVFGRKLHCVSKKQDTKLLPITFLNVNRFSNFFHWQTHW